MLGGELLGRLGACAPAALGAGARGVCPAVVGAGGLQVAHLGSQNKTTQISLSLR